MKEMLAEYERNIEEEYIFLHSGMPRWAYERVMLFKRDDGGVGYELDTGYCYKKIFPGDKLIFNGKYIKVERGACCDEAKAME